MIKKIFTIFGFLFFYLFSVSSAHAEGEFRTDVNVSYKVEVSGVTKVTHEVNLTNLFSDLYATSYSLVLENINPINIAAFDSSGSLKTEVNKDGTKTNISVFFNDSLVGKGRSRIFSITYDDQEIASRTGEVWEISIPKLSSDTAFNKYNLSLSVPLSFGLEAYLSPQPTKKETVGNQRFYNFNKENVTKTGITAGFGEFQVFSFNLTYHLENPLIKSSLVDIAIPPDTPLQKVYYESINPKPQDVKLDSDGNWIATFLLKSRERLDISAKGYVQIFASSRPFPAPQESTLSDNLLPTTFWQTQDPLITQAASIYKTPKAIYDFVVDKFTYNLDRAKPNVARLGAVEALKQPQNAICMEYTDTFVAIARAAGIPAREINGFAYTQNPKIQPLSLVSDVLHSWPEYWDSTKKTWVSIDPTWGSTTGGIDFFNKLDLRHFAFVIHGKDAQKPYPPGSYKLGPSPQKDVFVNFAQLPENRSSKIKISYHSDKFIPFTSQKINISVTNNGNAAAYNQPVNIYFDDEIVDTKNIEVLPPYANYKFVVKVPFSFLATKTPNTISVSSSEEKVDIPTFKNQEVIYNLVAILTLSFLTLIVILLKLGVIKLEKLTKFATLVGSRIKNAKGIFKKVKKDQRL